MRYSVILFLVAMLTTGCTNGIISNIKIGSKDQILVLSPSLRDNSLLFSQLKSKHSENEFTVEFKVFNQLNHDQLIEHRFDWYDAEGLELNEEGSPWEQVRVKGGASLIIKEIKTDPHARHVRVSLRRVP